MSDDLELMRRWAKAARAERDELRVEVERMTAERDALRAVYAAANDWLTRLGEKGHRYHDGVPGDLMDAIDAVATLRSGKL